MIKEMRGKDGNVVWRTDKSNNIYEYLFMGDCKQGKLIKKITFRDYTKKPIGFSQNGYGFRGALSPLFFLLEATFTEIDEIVVANQKSAIKQKKIYFNKKEYDSMVASLGTVYKENSNRLSDATLMEMGNIFPQKFKPKIKTSVYVSGTLARILSKKGVVDQMNAEDITKVVEILPILMDKSEKAKTGFLSKIRFTDLRTKSNKIELKKIIDEYDLLLGRKIQKESAWQDFFAKNILFFNSSYIKLIDKKNIDISISIPDFLLVDQFQFIDVFEIKRPDFDCLKYDQSHKNYYWSTETSMAISQVEKYLFQLELNANAVISDLRRQKVDVDIIRPRGYVLISKRSSLDENGQNSFRILNNSLKNVQVIFFDDFLNTLKSKYTIINKK